MRIGADHVAAAFHRPSLATSAHRDARHVRGRDHDDGASEKIERVADQVDVKIRASNAPDDDVVVADPVDPKATPADSIDDAGVVGDLADEIPVVSDSIGEDHVHGHGHDRPQHVLKKGGEALVDDVKHATKDLLKSIEGDKHSNREAHHLLRDFRAAVRDVVKTQRHAGEVDPATIASDLESAFAAFETGLREVFGGSAPATERPAVSDQPSLSDQAPAQTQTQPSALDTALAEIGRVFASDLGALLADLGYEAPAQDDPVVPGAPADPVDPVDPVEPPVPDGSGLVDFGPKPYTDITFGVEPSGLVDTIA